MARWICRVSLKDRKLSVELYSLLGIQGAELFQNTCPEVFHYFLANKSNKNAHAMLLVYETDK